MNHLILNPSSPLELLPQAVAKPAFLTQTEGTTIKITPWLRNSIIIFSLLFMAGCTHRERAREALLKEDLYHMRTAIDQYTQDKQMAPQHLADLVSAGYLHTIPKDPFTNSASTWIEVREDTLQRVNQTQPGVSDVHSGSNLVSSEGTRYDSW